MASRTQPAGPAPTLPATDDCRLSVVVPAYNEAGNIGPLVEETIDALDDTPAWQPYEIILVDDGSTDETAEQIQHAAALYEPVRGIELNGNHGQSAALAAGMDAASGEAIVPMDADRQNDPADIPRLLAGLEDGADCVSGWRKDRDDPLSKRVPSAIQTRLAMLTGPDIHDFGCSLKAYRAEALRDVSLRGEQHRYIPAQLDALGYEVREREVNHRPRTQGETKYGAGRLLRGFADLLYHIFAARYQARPMHVFGGLGILIFAVGVGLGGWLVVAKYAFGVGLLPNLPKLILSVALVLFGAGLVGLGLISELLTELLYRDDVPYRVARIHE